MSNTLSLPSREYSIRIPSFRLWNYPDVRRTCFDRRPLPSDNHCFRRRVQHANKHSRMKSRFPVAGLAGMYKIFSPKSRVGVLSSRPCSLCSGVFPSLPMSHLSIRYAANAMLQRSLQCSGLTSHESHCTLDDPIGLAFSHWRSLSGTDWLPSWRACLWWWVPLPSLLLERLPLPPLLMVVAAFGGGGQPYLLCCW